MKFPDVKVQPHWLAALERAKEVMPNVRWVCTAVDNGVEPEIEKEITAAISKAISPSMLVNTWYFRETHTMLTDSQGYRIAWLNHMIKQCRAKHKEEEEPDDECPHCAGTGEGQYDGQSCGVCRGKGVLRK